MISSTTGHWKYYIVCIWPLLETIGLVFGFWVRVLSENLATLLYTLRGSRWRYARFTSVYSCHYTKTTRDPVFRSVKLAESRVIRSQRLCKWGQRLVRLEHCPLAMTGRLWTPEAEESLIELWQQSACLYDISSSDYHNREEKDKRWREVSDALQMPSEFDLQEIWHKLLLICMSACVVHDFMCKLYKGLSNLNLSLT